MSTESGKKRKAEDALLDMDFRCVLGQLNPVRLQDHLRNVEIRREAERQARAAVANDPSDLRNKIEALDSEDLQARLLKLEKRQQDAQQAKQASKRSAVPGATAGASASQQLDTQQQQRRRELEREADEAVGRALLCLDEAVQYAAREEHWEQKGPFSWTYYSGVVRTLQATLAKKLNSCEPYRWLPLQELHWSYMMSGFKVHYSEAFLAYLASNSPERDRQVERNPNLDHPRSGQDVADKWCEVIQLLNILQYKRDARTPLPVPKSMLMVVCQFLSTVGKFFVVWRESFERKPRGKPNKKENIILQFMDSHNVTAPMRVQLMWFATHYGGFGLATQAETYLLMLDSLIDIWVGLYQASKIFVGVAHIDLALSRLEAGSANSASTKELRAQELETSWESRSWQVSLEYTAWALHVLLTRHAHGLPHEIDIGRASMFLHSSTAFMQRAYELLRPPQSRVSMVDLGASITAQLDTIGVASSAPHLFNIPATLLSYSSLLSSIRVQLNRYLAVLNITAACGSNVSSSSALAGNKSCSSGNKNSSSNGSSSSAGISADAGKKGESRACPRVEAPLSRKLISDAAGLLVSALIIRLQLEASLNHKLFKSAKPKDREQVTDLLTAKNVLNVTRAMLGESVLDMMLWLDSNFMLTSAFIPETLGIKLAELEIKALANSMTSPPGQISHGYPSHLPLARCQAAYTCVAHGSRPLALSYSTFKHCVHALRAHRPERLSKSLPPRLLIAKSMLNEMLELALQSWLDTQAPSPLGEQLPTMDVITDVICMLWPSGAPKGHTASSTSSNRDATTASSSSSTGSSSAGQRQSHQQESEQPQQPLPKVSLPPDVVSQLPKLMQVCGANSLALEQLIQAGNPALHAQVQTSPNKLTDIMSNKKELQRVVLDALITSHQKRHQQVQQQLAQERAQHKKQVQIQQQLLHDQGKGSQQAQHLLQQSANEDPIKCFESAWILWALEHVLLPCYFLGRSIELLESSKETQSKLIRLLEMAAKLPGLSLLLFLAWRALSRTDVSNTIPLADRHSIPRVLNILTASQDPRQQEHDQQQRQQQPSLSEEAWYWGRLKYAVSTLQSGNLEDPEDGSSAALIHTLSDLGKQCKSAQQPDAGKQPLAALDPLHAIDRKETRCRFIEEALAETAAPSLEAARRVLGAEASHPIACSNVLCRDGLEVHDVVGHKWCLECLKLPYCSTCAGSASFALHTQSCKVAKEQASPLVVSKEAKA